jgi:bifunctional non-homologous end joining protein LigD
MQTITLNYREGASDKVYQVAINQSSNGCTVDYSYGRRGSNMSTGTKTQTPVSLEVAQAIFQKLIQSKLSKGYKPAEAGPVYQLPEKEKLDTGVRCQLLNSIAEAELENLLLDRAHCMQEKFDGRRLLIRKVGTQITGINRQGRSTGIPDSLVEAARTIEHDFLLDGEAVGEMLYGFDLLELDGCNLRSESYLIRYQRLVILLSGFQQLGIQFAETAFLPRHKALMFLQLKAESKEGVVFKSCDAPHTGGRPNTGGSQLKFKFVETASFVVKQINEQRSVALLLFDDGKIRDAGNVTIPVNAEIPAVGSVVECRYLYAFRESGKIYQPVYLGVREDINPEECSTAQLKFKPQPEEAAA